MENLERWLESPERAWLSDAALRLARHVPDTHPTLSELLGDAPLARALAGLEAPGDPAAHAASLEDAVRATVAATDAGAALEVAWLADLEARTQAAPEEVRRRLWPLAAWAHARGSADRERAGRMELSDQDIPYVFPGELHPLQVEILAVGEVVVPALHVDWARKLTGLVAEVLELDLAERGLWVWPSLGVLPPQPLVRPLQRALRRRHRLLPGGAGLAAAYLEQLGQPVREALDGADGLVRDLARAGQQRTHA